MKKKINNYKKGSFMKKIIIIIGITILCLTGCTKSESASESVTKQDNKNIQHKEIKLSNVEHDWYGENPKYMIDSEKELEVFYKYYSTDLKKLKSDLDGYTLFIELSAQGSGSTELKLKKINFENNKINFIVEKNIPGIGTTDMAYWFLVGIIPNEQLEGKDISDWLVPSKVLKNE